MNPESSQPQASGDLLSGWEDPPAGELPLGWTVRFPGPASRPCFELSSLEGGRRGIRAAGNGSARCFGYLAIPVNLARKTTYRLQVRFRFEGFEDVNRHLCHGVFAPGFNDGIFTYYRIGESVVGHARFRGPVEDTEAEVRLYFRHSTAGSVVWDGLSLQPCDPIAPRLVRIAVCGAAGEHPRWERILDLAGENRCDVALLPEFFEREIHQLDGPAVTLMADRARRWRMYVCGAMRIRHDGLVYNSAPLFDREGKLVGIYDKRVPFETELENGTSAGDQLPVFQTDVGTIGIMTCYDSWFPEVSRVLAYRGAELLLFPSEGYYLALMPARAADNGLVIAASSINSPCGVWDSSGHRAGGPSDPTRHVEPAIVGVESDFPDGLQIVTVDLSVKPSPHTWGGPMRSAPGGRRVRMTTPGYLEDELAREVRRWWTDAPGGRIPP
jgi:predicted amidohydrolase